MVSPDEHLGERAELYALGALDATEADAVNAHAARCVACARLVGAAERAVTMLAEATVPTFEPPARLARRIAAIDHVVVPRRRVLAPNATALRYGALAASLLLVGGGAVGTRGALDLRATVSQDDAALATIANAHFKHATLTKIDPAAPTSKVLWGVSKRWLYVIVYSPGCACRVTAVTDAGERDLGAPRGHGATAALFADRLPGLQRIDVRQDGRTIERADLR